ncbi:MAG TPA: hemolysin family protein [Rhabdochlamydiaceae bacterium]|nr:hemolysin family protein [Rhabdochlamydiaceae bacterium]
MNVLLAVIFLISGAIVAGMTTVLLQLGRLRSKEEFKKIPTLFFFQHLLRPLFGRRKWEGLFFTLSFSKHVLHLCYGVVTIFILLTQPPFDHALRLLEGHSYAFDSLWVLAMGAIIITISLIADISMKFLATAAPSISLKLFAPISSIFLTLFSPLTSLFMKMLEAFFPESQKEIASPSIRDKILEVLYESELSTHLDPQERKLILSVANFKERNVREVMVPRIDVICISEEVSVQEAAELFLKERYSRLPVYHDSIDHIIGVLLYKDVLSAYANLEKQASIAPLIKPVLYTPETKKISQLLQEFRSKQIHLAIVVDEYGGTEGIITIEDILEELVGEIADEYDIDQEVLYSVLPSGGWIVDARMGILDIEKELAIQIPQSAEYDTLGGYIYHRAGAIPAKGWRLHHDDFDLEILSSDERSIEKVRIMPHLNHDL